MRRRQDWIGGIRVARKRKTGYTRNHEPPNDDYSTDLGEAIDKELQDALDRFPSPDLVLAYLYYMDKLFKDTSPFLAKQAKAVIDSEIIHLLSEFSEKRSTTSRGLVKAILVSIAANLARDGLTKLGEVIQALLESSS